MVYLIAELLGKPSYWFESDGRATPPLMSAERVRQLRGEGVDFGSHSASHAKLATLETPAIHAEVTRSKALLEDVLGEPVKHFCYPFGSHDRRAVDAVAEAGYASATTCVRAPASRADDPLTLPRKAISYGDNLIGYFWRLHVKNQPKRAFIRREGQTFLEQAHGAG
jgi:peptidoglycan/xylan/chitin deacetylase (PgdA/CDA1 family)